ncbi:hypothetical protein Fcan01_01756 [Folsomia candida]|uniref:Uncharacterized protein n=1 Tax=Folsomia candida TaxID=158441 RepID=A0A226F068_FOLCA|nr:hypothetical protein Fcan01_01756 [Folsomia candida]
MRRLYTAYSDYWEDEADEYIYGSDDEDNADVRKKPVPIFNIFSSSLLHTIAHLLTFSPSSTLYLLVSSPFKGASMLPTKPISRKTTRTRPLDTDHLLTDSTDSSDDDSELSPGTAHHNTDTGRSRSLRERKKVCYTEEDDDTDFAPDSDHHNWEPPSSPDDDTDFDPDTDPHNLEQLSPLDNDSELSPDTDHHNSEPPSPPDDDADSASDTDPTTRYYPPLLFFLKRRRNIFLIGTHSPHHPPHNHV